MSTQTRSPSPTHLCLYPVIACRPRGNAIWPNCPRTDPSSASAPTSSPSPSTLSRQRPGTPCAPCTSSSVARNACTPSASNAPRHQRGWSPRWGGRLAVSRMSAHRRRATSKL